MSHHLLTRRWPAHLPRVAAVLLAGASATLAAPELRLDAHAWEESVSVQSNGRVEPGESARLSVTLANRGDEAATDLVGTLVLAEAPAGVTLTGDATGWADLAAGASAEDDGSLSLAVDAGVACGERIALRLDVTAAGSPAASLELTLGVGTGDPSVTGTGAYGGGRGPMLAAGGGRYLLGWTSRSVANGARMQVIESDGTPVGDAVQLSPNERSAVLEVGWGETGWLACWLEPSGSAADAFCQGFDRDGVAVAPPTFIDGASAGNVSAIGFELTWTGDAWSLLYTNQRTEDPDVYLRRIQHVRLDETASVLGGPHDIEVGVRRSTASVTAAWTGEELVAFLNTNEAGESHALAIALDAPMILWRGPPVESVGVASLAWIGDGFLLTGVGRDRPMAWRLDARGRPLAGPYRVPGITTQREIDFSPFWEHLASASDGVGVAVAFDAMRVVPGSEDESTVAVMLAWLDRDGRRWRSDVRLTPESSEQFSVLGYDVAWNAEADQFGVAYLEASNFDDAWADQGAVKVKLVDRGAFCPVGEPPPEVSPPGSPVPLRMVKRCALRCDERGNEAWDVFAQFEDVGAPVYNIYHEFVAGSLRGLQGCHADRDRLGDAGSGALEWRVTQVTATGRRSLRHYQISASNESGEGPKGRDSFGLERAPLNSCGAMP